MHGHIFPLHSLVPGAKASSANGTGVDLQGYEAAEIIISTGVITDGSHVITLEESDDDSTYTAVAAGDLIGSLPAAITSSVGGSTVFKFGYKGAKRYIRVVTTIGSPTSGGIYSALIVRGMPRHVS